MIELLCNVTAVIGIDAELDELSVNDAIQCEDRIVNQSRALLSPGSRDQIQHKVDELDELLRESFGLQTKLVVLERANSIALYFICMTLFALMKLRNQWNSGKLRDIVQSLFNFLSYGRYARRQVRVKRLLWSQSDYERSEEFLSSLLGKLIIQVNFKNVLCIIIFECMFLLR